VTLNTVVAELLAAFPELKPVCDEEFDFYGDQPLDPYPVFATVFRRAVFDAIDKGDDEFLKRAFAFYERMATDPDERVGTLMGIELIEDVANDQRRLRISWPYMGEQTKREARAYASAVKRQFGKDVPLPE